jgi:hypothetical protein
LPDEYDGLSGLDESVAIFVSSLSSPSLQARTAAAQRIWRLCTSERYRDELVHKFHVIDPLINQVLSLFVWKVPTSSIFLNIKSLFSFPQLGVISGKMILGFEWPT